MMHRSVATISSPEFINLQPLDINPLMSKCEIKVLYVGENRNHSYITKAVATDMAKTLRGAPIVGYYKEENEDFADHGEQVVIDDEGIKFNCLTKPYGFVAPDAKVWFQEFEDTDDFGNNITREYLMTTGYLWTGQFEEAKRTIEKGNNQSMELDEESLKGHWATDNKNGMEFFIIDDAIFSKLCILGEDVEPCFEGASVTAPQVSSTFTKVDDDFKKTLFTMMQDLKFALGGGKDMNEEENKDIIETPEIETEEETVVAPEEEVAVEEEASVENEEEEVVSEDSTESVEEEPVTEYSDSLARTSAPVSEESTTEPEIEEAIEENPVEETINNTDEEEVVEEENVINEEEEVIEEENNEEEFTPEDYYSLKASYADLENKYAELVEFKKQIENEKKNELINKFYMLTEEDKKEVREHMEEYSLEDIEAKLSVICVRKKVNFDSEDTAKNNNDIEEESSTTVFNIQEEDENIPGWISACIKTQNSKK